MPLKSIHKSKGHILQARFRIDDAFVLCPVHNVLLLSNPFLSELCQALKWTSEEKEASVIPAGVLGPLSQHHIVASKATFHTLATATCQKATTVVIATLLHRKGKGVFCLPLWRTAMNRLLRHITEKDNTVFCTGCLLLKDLLKQRCELL